MFKIEIVAVGKLSMEFLKEGEREYLKRIKPFYDISVAEIPEQQSLGSHSSDEKNVMEIEGERILKYLSKKKYPVTALAVEGDQMSSEILADVFNEAAHSSSGNIFVIGGSLGLSDRVKTRADKLLSLSKMTFPHQLARIILLEQIYRAATINAGITYHK